MSQSLLSSQLPPLKHNSLWQKGDEHNLSAFLRGRAPLDMMCSRDLRTQSWLERTFKSYDSEKPLPGLIQRIQEAAEPICICAGLAHCIGSSVGLVEEFKKAGFEVTRHD